MKRNQQVGFLPVLKKEWKLTFAIKPTGPLLTGWNSILRATSTSGNVGRMGDRLPAILFHSNKNNFAMGIHHALSGNANYHFWSSGISKSNWTTVELKQEFVNGKYMFSVLINNVLEKSEENTKPQTFHDVKIFAGDNFYQPANAEIKHLVFESHGGSYEQIYSFSFNWHTMQPKMHYHRGGRKETSHPWIEYDPIEANQWSNFKAAQNFEQTNLDIAEFLVMSGAGNSTVNGLWKNQENQNGGKVVFKHNKESLYFYADTQSGQWHINSEIEDGDAAPRRVKPQYHGTVIKGGFSVASTSPSQLPTLVIMSGEFVFSVTINCKQYPKIRNPDPINYKEMYIYTGDFWHQGSGDMRNFAVTTSSEPLEEKQCRC